jgi:hypothetical protein
MENWQNTTKRFGLACFLSRTPVFPDGDGDEFVFSNHKFELIDQALRLMRGGRFHFIVLWDAQTGDWLDDFRVNDPLR